MSEQRPQRPQRPAPVRPSPTRAHVAADGSDRASGDTPAARAAGTPVQETTVRVRDAELDAVLARPATARGVVVFAHGTGSSRRSTRNRAVARTLVAHGFAVVLVDLLTSAEEREDQRTGQVRFDVDLLVRRVTDTVDWVLADPATAGLPLGLFGASTGAAGALAAAADRAEAVRAVVARGGRPDLASRWLPAVTAPTLLLVGALDHPVVALNREAASALGGPHRVHVVSGAGHLFEEDGALEAVSTEAAAWFGTHLPRRGGR